MAVLRVNLLSHNRKSAQVIGYVVEDYKILGRRSWNLNGNDAIAARLFEHDRWRSGNPDRALLHIVLSFSDGTPVSVPQAFDYFERLIQGTDLERQPTVVAAHEGRPHLHAIVSRVGDDGELVPIRITKLVERERELALRYGLDVLKDRRRPLPAAVLNAETWEGHLAFARYIRVLPWPERSASDKADRDASAALLRGVGISVTRVGRGWRLSHLYREKTYHAKASVCIPPAWQDLLQEQTAQPDCAHGYGALREAGKLILPQIKRGHRYREVVAANDRSAKGLGYWHRRLAPPAPTWTAAQNESRGPQMIAFLRTGDPELDEQLSARLDAVNHETVDAALVQGLRADLERVETTRRMIDGKQILFARDELALAIRQAAEMADRTMDWTPAEGVPGPCRAFVLFGDVNELARIKNAHKQELPFGDEPSFEFFGPPEKRGLTLAGSVPRMIESSFLNQLRQELSPLELAHLRREYGIDRVDVDANHHTTDVLEQSSLSQHEEGQQSHPDGNTAVARNEQPIPQTLEAIAQAYNAFWDAMDRTTGTKPRRLPIDQVLQHGTFIDHGAPNIERTATHYGETSWSEISHENFSGSWKDICERTPELDALYDAFVDAAKTERQRRRSATSQLHQLDIELAPGRTESDAVIASAQARSEDDQPFIIAPATADDHSRTTASANGAARNDKTTRHSNAGTGDGDPHPSEAQVNKLLNAWAIYLDHRGVNPERTKILLNRQRDAIYAYIRLAGDLRTHALADRKDKTKLLRSTSLLAQTTAAADFSLAAASADLGKPLHSPGEFAIASDTKSFRTELFPPEILLALGRGDHTLPMGARPLTVAKALASMQWTDARIDPRTQDVQEPGFWTVSEEAGLPPTLFTEQKDGYHFSRDNSKNGINGIRAALILAANEDDGAVTLTGTHDFQTMVGRIAAQMGIVVTNNRDRLRIEDAERTYRHDLRKSVGSRDPKGCEAYLERLIDVPSLKVWQDVPHQDERLTIVEVGQKRVDNMTATLAYNTSRQLVCSLLPLATMTEQVRGPKGMEERQRDCRGGDVIDLVFGQGGKPRTEAVQTDMQRAFAHEHDLLQKDDRQVRSTRPAAARSR